MSTPRFGLTSLIPLSALGIAASVALAGAGVWIDLRQAQIPARPDSGIVQVGGLWQKGFALKQGQAVEISVHLVSPSALPPNGRLGVEWTLDAGNPFPAAETNGRNPDAFGIYQRPTPSWRKTLHALDPDVFVVYRAPATGKYVLRLAPIESGAPVGDGPRWREKGSAPALTASPERTPWPKGLKAPVRVAVNRLTLDPAEQERLRTYVECEPNDTPEQAQPITLIPGEGIRTYEMTGTADDIEFFDNGRVGRSGDDWFRLDYRGKKPQLLTAQISIPGQVLAARIRAYKREAPAGTGLLSISEYFGNEKATFHNEAKPIEGHIGRDPNERVHQQDEEHRANITRMLYPGETYFLRVEANAPGYQLQLRVLPPPPYEDPVMAVRQGVYTQIGQVDSWLTNRPRGASIERRIRDSGNLLGTNCMSCHTQSGVWGPAGPFLNGYRPENALNYAHLIQVMYECLRPTNVLKEAANNTSLAPLDVGDGPAGTRAAGFNIVNAERFLKPRRLHSRMQLRTANYVLQTADPGGINAADKGSNVGQMVVYTFATEILRRAWETTGDPVYFRAMEQKARAALKVEPRYTDDVALRLDYFHRLFPIKQYAAWSARARAQTAVTAPRTPEVKALPVYSEEEARRFVEAVSAKLVEDEARLRQIQNEDGSWGFNPGSSTDGGKTWTRGGRGADSDPSPTALGIWALTSAGYGRNEPAVAKAVKSLLARQEPSGRWNYSAITGFVTTAYALHALARLYPDTPAAPRRDALLPDPGESLPAAIGRVRTIALQSDPALSPLLLREARHPSPLVRWWALIGLGMVNPAGGVPILLGALEDPAKPVREAATWALRQTLLDDKGWDAVLTAYEQGSDHQRAQIAQALNMRADAVMPRAGFSWPRLTRLLDRGMNQDRNPAVRAWSAKAAWQWWVWNPPARQAINAAWVKLLSRPEPIALVESANRYSTQALFIVNGHRANGSREHQYPELEKLFEAITAQLDGAADPTLKTRLARRLVAVAGTFYETRGSDGGPGQMGYITSGAGEMMGKAALAYLEAARKRADQTAMKAGIEGASAVPWQPLTAFLVNYSLKGPEELRQLAASAVSDPRSVSLAAVPELVEPQLQQVLRGAREPARRAAVSDPIIDLWAKVNWQIPGTEEQQRAFFNLIIPKLDTYVPPGEAARIADPAERGRVEKEMDAQWYLADRLGWVLQQNPDLHHEIVFRSYFPAKFRNPLEEHFWIRSVEWLLNFAPGVRLPPSLKDASRGFRLAGFSQNRPAPEAQTPDEALTIKDRALQLYLDQLKPEADPRTRAVAIRMSNQTALRRNPEVLRALEAALRFEKDEELRRLIQNVLKQSSEKFMPELMEALRDEKHPSISMSGGAPAPTKAQVDDLIFFRDFIMPELNRQKRADQMSCVACHGVEGRVPTFYIRPPDKYGYLPVKDLLFNYRTVQGKVNLTDIERSKLLRKPLNIQDGKEDGHQGGRRYAPNDPEYLLIRRWVLNQPAVQTLPAAPASKVQ